MVADFIVDHSVVEETLCFVDKYPWRLYFDGSSHKNGVGIGVLIISPHNIPTKYKFKIQDLCSNNEAEYEALIVGLEILLELGASHVEIRGDSELVIKQLTKEYKCIKEHLIKYFIVANTLLRKFEYVHLEHLPRIDNQVANELAQIASGYKVSKQSLEELIEIRDKLIPDDSSSYLLSTPKTGGGNRYKY